MEKKITEYDLEYKGVKCTGVNWEEDVFFLILAGENYEYTPEEWISCSADTDHIRCVIEEFIEKFKEKLFQEYIIKKEKEQND